ncbi:MAG: helix-turn-helix domain-containing protein [Thermomicrobiales bacterium]
MGGAGNLIPIGRFSQICRLTIKAPRYYDDQGLLKPALVDPQSGYRHYGLGQVAVADRIRALREIDMPLEEIAAALRERDPAAISACLTVYQRRLEQQIAALEFGAAFGDAARE